jgi:hypothetical protein
MSNVIPSAAPPFAALDHWAEEIIRSLMVEYAHPTAGGACEYRLWEVAESKRRALADFDLLQAAAFKAALSAGLGFDTALHSWDSAPPRAWRTPLNMSTWFRLD